MCFVCLLLFGCSQLGQTPRSKKESIVLMIVGDIMLDRGVGKIMDKKKSSDHPFRRVKEILRSADLVVGNLESTLSDKEGAPCAKRVCFKGRPAAAKGIRNAGVGLVSLANNHALDFGPSVLGDTVHHLNKNKIRYFGVIETGHRQKPTIVTVHGQQIGFLGFHRWSEAPCREGDICADAIDDEIFSDISSAKQGVDFLVVYFHLGQEYKTLHNANQEIFSKKAIDSGADIVVSSHPHVLQDDEVYKGKHIIYSLGNFVFDQPTSRTPAPKKAVRTSEIRVFEIHRDTDVTLHSLPVCISDEFQPYVSSKECFRLNID